MVLAGTVTCAAAQSNFTIVRPSDGSHVKETVRILLPKKSVPEVGGYVGVFLNGKFLEARGPQSLIPKSAQLRDKYLEYDLDTKALGVEDSAPGKPSKLELVLYVDFQDHPRVSDRSSIDIYVGNKASIPIPEAGLKLRYAFQSGTESIYKLERTVALASITKGQNSSGGRGNEEEVAKVSNRMLYAIDDHYANGDGLVRMQYLPDAGKDYTMATVRGEPKRWDDSQLEPWYMRQTSTGMEVWSSLPIYFGIDGVNGQGPSSSLLTVEPFPSLPAKNVKVGSIWNTRFLQDVLVAGEDWHSMNKFTQPLEGRGELASVEWENGHPCAVIHNTIRFGDQTTSGEKLKKAGAKFTDNKIELDEYVWFSLDSKRVLRVRRTESIDLRADQLSSLNLPGLDGGGSSGANGGGAGQPGAGGQGQPGGQGGPVIGGASGAGGGAPGKAAGGLGFIGHVNLKQRGRGGQGGPPPGFGGPGGPPPGFGGPGGPPGGAQGRGQAGFGNGRMGQSNQTNNELAFFRVKITTVLTLEN